MLTQKELEELTIPERLEIAERFYGAYPTTQYMSGFGSGLRVAQKLAEPDGHKHLARAWTDLLPIKLTGDIECAYGRDAAVFWGALIEAYNFETLPDFFEAVSNLCHWAHLKPSGKD